jgi:hypothetical protein
MGGCRAGAAVMRNRNVWLQEKSARTEAVQALIGRGLRANYELPQSVPKRIAGLLAKLARQSVDGAEPKKLDKNKTAH